LPKFIISLWLIGIPSVCYLMSLMIFADDLTQLPHTVHKSGEIIAVDCQQGARPFMDKELQLTSIDSKVEFSQAGECAQLLDFYHKAKYFESIQVEKLLAMHSFSIKIDGVEQLNFDQQVNSYNLYHILSPLSVPLFLAMVATFNWYRGKWR